MNPALLLNEASFRKEQRDVETHAPVRAAGGTFHKVAAHESELDRMLAEHYQLRHLQFDGHRPFALRPVVGGFGLKGKRPLALRRISQPRIDSELLTSPRPELPANDQRWYSNNP